MLIIGGRIIEQAEEIISASADVLCGSENIDQEVLGEAVWELNCSLCQGYFELV